MSVNKNVPTDIADVTPESLMERFRGTSMVKMVVVTVVFHVVLVLGTSVAYLKKSLLGDKVAAMSKEQRIEKAVSEATSSIRKIATENGLSPQEISDNFSSSAAKAAKLAAETAANAAASLTNAAAVKQAPAAPEKNPDAGKPERPESKIEQDLKKAVKGPDAPPPVGKDDIF